MADSPESYAGYYPESELVIGIVCTLGTDYGPVLDTVSNYLQRFGYGTNRIQPSDKCEDRLTKLGASVPERDGAGASMWFKILAGNEIRRRTRSDALALVAVSAIASRPQGVELGMPKPLPTPAHLIVSLKDP